MVCKKALEETGGDMNQAFEYLRKKGEATAAKRQNKEVNQGKISVKTGTDTVVIYEVNCETDFVARNEDFQNFVNALGDVLLANKPADVDAAKTLTSDAFGGKSVEERMKELIGKIGEKIDFTLFNIHRIQPEKEKPFSYIHGKGNIGVLLSLICEDESARNTDEFAQLGKDIAMQIAAARPVSVNREGVPEDISNKEREIYLAQIKESGKPEKIWDKIIDGKMNKFYSQIVLLEQEFIKNPDISVTQRIDEVKKATGVDISIAWFDRFEIGYNE